MHNHTTDAVRLSLLLAGIVVWGQGCASIRAGSSLATGATGDGSPVAEAEARQLNVQVLADGQGQTSHALARGVQEILEARLAEEGYFVSDAYPDITVEIEASVQSFDQSGNYIVYDGTLAGTVTRAADNRLLAGDRLTARGIRALGEGQAMDNLLEAFVEPAGNWATSSLSSARAGLAVEDITVRRVWYSPDRPEYATVFTTQINQLDGIISCRLIAEDRNARSMVFRVAYFKDSFPGGLLNRLVLIPAIHLQHAR